MKTGVAILAAGLALVAVSASAGSPATAQVPTRYVSLQTKLKSIVIPEVDFKDARVEDVFEFIIDASREYDTLSSKDRKGVNIILNVTQADRDKTVTFKGKKFSVMQLVETLCTIGRLDYTIRGNFMMVASRGAKAEGGTRVVRTYAMPLTLVSEIKKEGAKKYFESMGVRFPEGASARYVAATGRLIVVNTPKNTQMLDKIVRGLGGRIVVR